MHCSGIQFEKTFENSLSRKLFNCNQCDFTSVHSNDLIKHWKTHTGEESFKCNQCNYAFEKAFENSLWGKIRHMQPMRLRICSLRRFEKTFEKSHWIKVIEMQPMRICICFGRQFEKTFWRKINYMQPMRLRICSLRRFEKKHLMSHTREKSLKCNQCDYASVLAGDLKKHLKTHS